MNYKTPLDPSSCEKYFTVIVKEINKSVENDEILENISILVKDLNSLKIKNIPYKEEMTFDSIITPKTPEQLYGENIEEARKIEFKLNTLLEKLN